VVYVDGQARGHPTTRGRLLLWIRGSANGTTLFTPQPRATALPRSLPTTSSHWQHGRRLTAITLRAWTNYSSGETITAGGYRHLRAQLRDPSHRSRLREHELAATVTIRADVVQGCRQPPLLRGLFHLSVLITTTGHHGQTPTIGDRHEPGSHCHVPKPRTRRHLAKLSTKSHRSVAATNTGRLGVGTTSFNTNAYRLTTLPTWIGHPQRRDLPALRCGWTLWRGQRARFRERFLRNIVTRQRPEPNGTRPMWQSLQAQDLAVTMSIRQPL